MRYYKGQDVAFDDYAFDGSAVSNLKINFDNQPVNYVFRGFFGSLFRGGMYTEEAKATDPKALPRVSIGPR